MSIGYVPPRPDGAGPQGKFFQWVYDCLLNRLRQQDAPNSGSGRTTRGFYTVPGRTGGGSGSQVATFKLKDVADDYLICVTHDPDSLTDGTTPVNVAKEKRHRNSITSEVIFGITHTYTYADGPSETWTESVPAGLWGGTKTTYNRKRTDNAEEQRIVQPWIENEIFLAIKCKTGVIAINEEEIETAVAWHITGRSAMWCKIPE